MSFSHWSLALLILAAGSCAAAPKMYKSVTADGKVVYTDRPPIESATETRIMQGALMSPVAGFSAVNERNGYLVQASSASLSRPVSHTESALVRVMARQRIPHVLGELCVGTEGKEAAKLAVQGWKERNAVALRQKSRMLSDFVKAARRVELEQLIFELERAERNRLATLAPARIEQWCGATINELANGKLDIIEPLLKAERPSYDYYR